MSNFNLRCDYEFSDRNSGSDLRIHLRGSGPSSLTSGVVNAYRLDIDSDSTTVKLKKLVSGTATTLAEYDYDPDHVLGPDPGRHSVRFVVNGSSIKVRLWPACSGGPKCARYDEPSVWQLQADDTTVTTPGKLQLTHYYDGSGSARAVYFDDLTLSIPSSPVVAFADSGFVRNDYSWDLGAPEGKREPYNVCDIYGPRMECRNVGETRFNAWVHLQNRSTDRLEVKLDVIYGPDLRVEFKIECIEEVGSSRRSCGHRNWDTVSYGRSHGRDFANVYDLTGFTFDNSRRHKLYFTSTVSAGDDYGWTVQNPVYETGWIDCRGAVCKFT